MSQQDARVRGAGYLSHPGMDERLFMTLFDRKPNEDIVAALGEGDAAEGEP